MRLQVLTVVQRLFGSADRARFLLPLQDYPFFLFKLEYSGRNRATNIARINDAISTAFSAQ